MAGKRLLSDSISTSGRLNRLSPEAFNLWTLCHPHTDRDGRLPADREDLIGQCFPRRYIFLGWTHEIVDGLIQELVDAELWLPLVDDCGVAFIAELRFREHQPGLHPGKYLYDKREKASKYQYSGPDPDDIVKVRARDVHAVCTPGAPDVHAMCKKTPQVQAQVQAQEKGEEAVSSVISHARAKSITQANPAILQNLERPPSSEGWREDPERTSQSNGIETIGCRNTEWVYAKEEIYADFRLAIGRSEWGPSNIDKAEAKKDVAMLQNLSNRVYQLREADRRAISKGSKRTHLLADAIQELRNGDCSRTQQHETGIAPPSGFPDWIDEARAKGWS